MLDVCYVDLVGCDDVVFLLFKQKTSYEMRISDWSSDVGSSDLAATGRKRSSSQSDGKDRSFALRLRLPGDHAVDIERDQRADRDQRERADEGVEEIGRASGRERGCESV